MSSSITTTTGANGTISNNLLWASTGGGWRAMFADVGYANVFAQAGLLQPTTSAFRAVSTVSGGSWFSTQLFYSPEFYAATALAASPQEISDFVVKWMGTYYDISTDISPEDVEACDFSDLRTDSNEESVDTLEEVCQLLEKFDYDWAHFIDAMLTAASSPEAAGGYGTAGFVDIPASADNIHVALQNTDLLIQTALAPASRMRPGNGTGSANEAVYLGTADSRLWTVALSAAWIVDAQTGSAEWAYGIEESEGRATGTGTASTALRTYVAQTREAHVWSDWAPFYYYRGRGTTTGTALIDNTVGAELEGPFQAPFGGITPTSLQVAATSSAAAGSISPMVPVSYSQNWSIGGYTINTYTTETVWRVLAGIAAGLCAGLLLGWAIAWATDKWNWTRLCQSCNTRKKTRPSGGKGTAGSSISTAKSPGVGEAPKEAEGDPLGETEEGVARDDGDDGHVALAGAKDETSGDAEGEAPDDDEGETPGGPEGDAPGAAEEEAPGDAEEKALGDAKVDTECGTDTEYNNCCCCSCERPARMWAIGCGTFLGLVVGVCTGVYYGLGSIFVPNFYTRKVDELYQNGQFDNFAVCSQWPSLPCQEQDGFMIDGWFVDNPALAINIGHTQTKVGGDETIKVLLTNTNNVWDSEWVRAQYLAYFSTYFNEDIAPGDFSWGPDWYIPSRSQQIFSEYLDADGLDALLKPIANSNMTTALLQGTTVDNPAYNVRAGQRVEMLLLNCNHDITTNVIGKSQIEKYTQPLADMASHIAGSEELVARVVDFVTE